jgi:Spy/CpxP family protein refolding chaperone
MNRFAWLVLLFGMLALPAGVLVSGEGEGGPPAGRKDEGPRPPRPGVIGKFILEHAQELNLTEDQTQQIKALLKEHQKEHQGEGPGHPGGPGKPGDGADKPGDGKHGEGPFAEILTEEQHNKLREMLKAGRPRKGPPPADGGQ